MMISNLEHTVNPITRESLFLWSQAVVSILDAYKP